MDINNVPAVDEYPLSYPTPTAPASLKNLAVTTLALDLWRQNGDLNRDSFSCTEFLTVPLSSCLEELIDKRIISLCPQMRRLCSSFMKCGILRNDDEFFRSFNSLTYATEDEICPEKSAVKILRNGELTELEKFKIACFYWLENDIRRIWPSVSDHRELNGLVNFDPFIRYWVAVMVSGGVHFRDGRITQFFLTPLIILVTMECGNWTAFVGIVNQLSRQDQFNFLTEFIRHHSPINYFLTRLNREQANYVLQNHPDEIISKLASQKECFAYVLKIWNLVKESISSRCFVKLLNYLCYGGYTCDKSGKCHVEAAQVRLVLNEVWNTVPSRIKRQIFENNDVSRGLMVFSWRAGFDNDRHELGCDNEFSKYKHLPKFFEERRKDPSFFPICFDHEIDFFFKLFGEMPPEMRVSNWRIYWRGIVIRSRSQGVNGFLSLCLRNENEIRRFVEEEMFNLGTIASIVDLWRTQKLYDEMIDYTNLCTWNIQLVDDFRKQVFLYLVRLLRDVSCDKLIGLATDIDGHLSNAEIAKDAKRTIFLSGDVKKFFRFKLSKGSTREAINVIDCFLKTERSQCEKQLLLDLWFDFLIDGQDNEFDGRWEEFLSWWEGNGDEWPIFKQFLNVDEISIKLLLEALPNLVLWLNPMEINESEMPLPKINGLEEFSSVDGFLLWYFETEAAVRGYKLEKISNYEKTPALRNIFRIYNEFIIGKVLAWFFDGDLVEVDNFKNSRIKSVRRKKSEFKLCGMGLKSGIFLHEET